ncbi:CYM1 [Candida oxycetoniae]|uniref:Presequence protease, mitochondrial n=1 Tax=Candida oxycetoniae TaxID=497107 RepID=A0AAI9SZP3_9ASCO|nr:CYM1 [Candida oxycetoniae]KAI3406193.2 CYM1 [Candida oxycetoniae]
MIRACFHQRCLRAQTFKRYAHTNSSLLEKYPLGLKSHGFQVLQAELVPEFSLVAVLLKHEESGAQHLHLDSPNDHNNVFSIAFKTNPPDSTGVAHILEHTTLCGSTKYPVRDPFFKMTNRSLSNFMNAMTGHDYTFYPFATTNPKDFENLMDVYLSSVFQPLLNYNDFLQEGWRLENSVTDDINSKLEFKGVVFNEMKGQYSNTMYYFYIKFLESIYPSLNNAGGDPLKMTNLKYQELKKFHSDNYNASNAKSFTYGNLPLNKHLQKLDKYYKDWKQNPSANSNIVLKKPIFTTNNQKVYDFTVPGPVDPMIDKDISEQYHSSVTWYLGNPLDPQMHYMLFKWKILGSLLFDGHNSPFYQELIETGYSEDFSANSGLDSTTALFSLTVGLNFLTKEKVDGLENRILGIMNDKVLPELRNPESAYYDRVKALLHQIEIGFKKHKPDFGFGLLSSLVPSWVNGSDPINQLRVEKILSQFKNEFEAKGLSMFETMLKESILNKESKKFKFTMVPQVEFYTKLADAESNNLEAKVQKLTKHDKEVLFNRNIELKKSQSKEEDSEVLPTLTIEDIPPKGEFYSVNYANVKNKNSNNNKGEKNLSERIIDTNGLVYAYALKDISFLPTKYYKFLPLFNSCLTNLAGTTETSITDLETKIQIHTGGISFASKASANPYNINQVKMQYSLSGVALREDARHVYDLWYEILTQTRFSAEEDDVFDKLTTLIKNMGQNQINNIADRGHSYACGESNSKLTPSGYIADLTSGLTQVQFVMEMNKKLEEKGKEYLCMELLPILKNIQTYILRGDFKYRLVGDKDIISENEKLIAQFDEKVSGEFQSSATNELAQLLDKNINNNNNNKTEKLLVNLPFQVGYSCLAKIGAPYCSKDGAALQILSQLYTFKNLHSKVREINGAYGGGLNYDGLGGTLDFYSYRDPNPIKSIQTFEESFPYGLDANWNEKDLTEAKLRIFQSVDAPINISSQGAVEFFEGISYELEQERRENFLTTTNQDLVDVTQKYLVGNPINMVTVIGDEQILKVKDDWKIKNLK